MPAWRRALRRALGLGPAPAARVLPLHREVWRIRIDESGLKDDLAFVRHDGKVFYGYPTDDTETRRYDAVRRTLAPELGDLELHPRCFHLAVEVANRYAMTRELYLPQAGLIVEAGAYLGFKVLRFAATLRVVAIEMVSRNFAVLQRNIRENNAQAVAIQYAVWNEPGNVEVKGRGRQQNSLLALGSNYETVERVPSNTIDRILDEAGVDTADYINIQVNRVEVQALQGLTPGRCRTVRVVCSEATYPECIALLRAQGAEILESNRPTVAYARFPT